MLYSLSVLAPNVQNWFISGGRGNTFFFLKEVVGSADFMHTEVWKNKKKGNNKAIYLPNKNAYTVYTVHTTVWILPGK